MALSTTIREPSPALLARLTGLLLIVMACCAGFAELGVRAKLVVPGDAAATASRILASQQLFRAGLLGYVVAFLCDVPVAILFYVLLKPAGPRLSLTAAAFRLVYAAVVSAALANYFGALTVLSGGRAYAALQSDQVQTLALIDVIQFSNGFGLALVFFGVHLLLLGWLLWRSPRFPRVIGPLIVVAGLSYLANSLSLLLAPAFNARVARFLAVPAMTELALALWLVFKGVRPLSARD
jgi:hypothetical protein